MELPDDVLSVVRDFSRPVTRPDWRTLRRMPSLAFHIDFATTFNTTFKLVLLLFLQSQSSNYVHMFHEGTIQHIGTPYGIQVSWDSEHATFAYYTII
jgi:hypothetical protein